MPVKVVFVKKPKVRFFMIEQVLKNVRAAEERAENIKAEAESKAAAKRFAADTEARRIAEEAKERARCEADAASDAAAKRAEEESAATQRTCEAQCEKLKADLESKVAALAKEIFGRAKDGGC